jgi:hypothetical protein
VERGRGEREGERGAAQVLLSPAALLVVRALADHRADVVVAHLGVVLIAVLADLGDQVVVALSGEVHVLVSLVDAVECAHWLSLLAA